MVVVVSFSSISSTPFSLYLTPSMSVSYLLSLIKALLQQISPLLAICSLHDSEHIVWSNLTQIKEKKKRNFPQVYISFIFFKNFLTKILDSVFVLIIPLKWLLLKSPPSSQLSRKGSLSSAIRQI